MLNICVDGIRFINKYKIFLTCTLQHHAKERQTDNLSTYGIAVKITIEQINIE
jgi:hypothetical protein